MPAPRDPQSYPFAFWSLLEHFTQSDKDVVLTLSTPGEAAQTRFTFYNFKKALMRAGEQNAIMTCSRIMARISDCTITFTVRDNQRTALQLEAAITAAQGAPLQRPQIAAPVPAPAPAQQSSTGEDLPSVLQDFLGKS